VYCYVKYALRSPPTYWHRGSIEINLKDVDRYLKIPWCPYSTTFFPPFDGFERCIRSMFASDLHYFFPIHSLDLVTEYCSSSFYGEVFFLVRGEGGGALRVLHFYFC